LCAVFKLRVLVKNSTMVGCAVLNCDSNAAIHRQVGIKFYDIPEFRLCGPPHSRQRSERRRALWLTRIGRMDVMYEKTCLRVCSKHFVCGTYTLGEFKLLWEPDESLRVHTR